jgi:hypothetical protein
MSQGLVSVVLESETEGSRIHDYVNDLSTAHIVVLDDGETYGAAEASMIWLDGKGYLVSELLDFYLASVNAEPENAPPCQTCGLESTSCGCPMEISGGPYAGCRDDMGLDEDDQ